ncbi:MAG: CAP domain-containing protein [Roseinatronobacter sp.]
MKVWISVLVMSLTALPVLGCPTPPAEEQEVHLAAVNAERARHGQPALHLSPELSVIAQLHACDMAQRGYFSHTSPEGIGMMGRVRRAGLTYVCWAGENIAHRHRDIPTVIESWMRSPGHRSNILSDQFQLVGFGRSKGPFWVQVFGGAC